jgi:hypothetical protein
MVVHIGNVVVATYGTPLKPPENVLNALLHGQIRNAPDLPTLEDVVHGQNISIGIEI